MDIEIAKKKIGRPKKIRLKTEINTSSKQKQRNKMLASQTESLSNCSLNGGALKKKVINRTF